MADENDTTDTNVDKSAFNYGDTNAVVKLTKRVMSKNGYYSREGEELDSTNWGRAEESAWAGFCDRYGGVYSPRPEIYLQPPHIKEMFKEFEGEVEFTPFQSYSKGFNAANAEIQGDEDRKPASGSTAGGEPNFGAILGTNLESVGSQEISNNDSAMTAGSEENDPPTRTFVLNNEVRTVSTDVPKLPPQQVFKPTNPDKSPEEQEAERQAADTRFKEIVNPGSAEGEAGNTPAENTTGNNPNPDDPTLKVR